jgi:hypothetical protein
MDQIKHDITDKYLKVWVRHTEYHHHRDRKDEEDVIGTSYLKAVFDPKEDAYRVTGFKIHPEYTNQDWDWDLFRSAYELASSQHKGLVSEGVIPASQRRRWDYALEQGNRRQDLPFGKYRITSGSMAMREAQKERHHEDTERPQLTRETQGVLWSLADSLARALRDPQGDQPGDARFTVAGISESSWSISHPDLEILESGESPLILRIRKIKEGKWGVFGQNQLKNLLNTQVLSFEKSPPDKSWDLDYISQKAAAYFHEQKDKITQLKQKLSPSQPPGAGYQPQAPGAPPGGGGEGMGAPPMASRRVPATLGNLRRAERVASRLNLQYTGRSWYGGAQTVNDRYGVGLRVRLLKSPGRRLGASIQGFPVEWIGTGVRCAGKPKRRRVYSEDKDNPQEEETHQDLVNRVYKYLLSRRRPYSSVKYLARVLKIAPEKLAKALGELIVQERINFVDKKFRPVIPAVKPQEERAHITSTTSIYKKDIGNWRHRDGLDSTLNTEIPTQDAPEDKDYDDISRVMPDPYRPN